MKKVRRWLGVFGIGAAIIFSVTFSIISLGGNAFADDLSSGDISAIKQNVLYKSVFSNLQKCYSNMAGKVDETQDSVWSKFDSTTYFKSEALASDFLKFPFDVGKRNESSCPKMITGWHNNWFIDLFKGDGSYSGLLSFKTGAVVPDPITNTPEKMGKFLTDIGYVKNRDTTTMGDRKCFYLKFKINDSVYDSQWLPKPAGNNGYFETVDFCVLTDNNGNLTHYNNSIIALTGNNEYYGTYDDGHLKDDSNIVFINFPQGLAPEFRHLTYGDLKDKDYLQANIVQLDLRYPFYSEAYEGNTLEATTIYVKNITKNNASDETICKNLGYYYCHTDDKGLLYTRDVIGALSAPGDSISYSTFKSRMKTLLEKAQTEDGYYLFSNVSTVDYTPGATSYNKGTSNAKFMNYFLGNTSNFNNGTWTDAEKYVLFYTYLKESYNVATTTTSIDNGVQVSWLNDDGTFSKVYVYDPDENLNDKKYIPQRSTWSSIEEANWKQIAERMAEINVTDAFSEVGVTDPVLDPDVTPDDPDSPGDNNEGAETPTCYNAAGSLGWILCPVLDGLGSVVDGLYDNVIVPQFLEIDSSLMSTENGGSIYKGWQDFRNFANIIFAILFIIVILSQVTGIGISNYNIKKILPRLVMIVALVNISFILCQLAVDVSNILGFQLKEMFVKMAGDTVVTVGGFVGNVVPALVSTAVTGGIIIGAGIVLAGTWEFWLFPLLLFLLGVVVSIFFFAIILGVRKAGILILIVLAPVAVVCYALPNTKKFFDRWFKLFTSLILVYPICGLLMGGGQYASTLLLGAAGGDDVGFFMALVAMLIQVVPFFFIPTLVKGSLAAMGNLGMKISNMGSRVSGGLQRGVRGSEGIKEMERSLGMRNAERSFKRLNRKIEKREKAGRDVSSSLNHRRSNAAARFNRMAYEDIRAGGTQELLSEGSAGRVLAEQSARTEQLNKDIASQQSLYESNSDFADEQLLGNEYEAALNEFIANPTSREAEIKVKALQNILSETDAGRSQVQNRMIAAMQANAGSLTNGAESGLSKAASHLMSGKLGATYKAKNRGMFSMIGDLSRKQYDTGTQEMRDAQGNIITDPATGQARHHAFQRTDLGTDSAGKKIFNYSSSYYDRSGLSSYTAETLAGADEGAIDRIMDGISNGNIDGRDLQAITETASEALNSDTVRVQPKIAQKLRQIERSGYAASPSAFARASDASLGDIASRIQSGEIKDTAQSPELTRLALSAQSALRDPAALHSPETAERLNQILTAAGVQGAVDAATGSRFSAVDSASIKIRGREAPKPRQAAPVPQGWTDSGIWVGGGSGPTRQQQIAYDEWARHAAEVARHNSQINNPPNP